MNRFAEEMRLNMEGIKLVTFNIRCDYEQDGINNFAFRKPMIVEKISSEKPDIICFQEVLPHVAVWIKETLSDYYVVGCGRSEDFTDEQESIAFKKDRFNLVSMETYWMSETPYVPASRYKKQSTCPRVTTEVVLYDLAEKKMFRLLNTHLDHEGSEARLLGLNQLLRKLEAEKAFSDIPVIITGDFNAEPDSEEMRSIITSGRYQDLTKDIDFTFHDYGKEKEKIDYIFATKDVFCKSTAKWAEEKDGVFLSDHYPIEAVIYLSEGGNHG